MNIINKSCIEPINLYTTYIFLGCIGLSATASTEKLNLHTYIIIIYKKEKNNYNIIRKKFFLKRKYS